MKLCDMKFGLVIFFKLLSDNHVALYSVRSIKIHRQGQLKLNSENSKFCFKVFANNKVIYWTQLNWSCRDYLFNQITRTRKIIQDLELIAYAEFGCSPMHSLHNVCQKNMCNMPIILFNFIKNLFRILSRRLTNLLNCMVHGKTLKSL